MSASFRLAWAFQTNQAMDIKSTPLVVDGVMYFSVPDKVWAVDALSGQQIWHYTYPPNHGLHIGNRGLGMYKNWLYFLVPGRPPGFAQRQRRQRALGGAGGRRYERILDQHGAAGGWQSCAGGHFGRF